MARHTLHTCGKDKDMFKDKFVKGYLPSMLLKRLWLLLHRYPGLFPRTSSVVELNMLILATIVVLGEEDHLPALVNSALARIAALQQTLVQTVRHRQTRAAATAAAAAARAAAGQR